MAKKKEVQAGLFVNNEFAKGTISYYDINGGLLFTSQH